MLVKMPFKAFSTLHLHILSPDLTKGSIWTNASNRGLEAILLQEHGGMLHPLQFYNATIANQKLLDHETGYSMTESKYLAIVWAIYTFSGHLFGQEFTLETDLKTLSKKFHIWNSQQKQQQCQWINVVIFSFARVSISYSSSSGYSKHWSWYIFSL